MVRYKVEPMPMERDYFAVMSGERPVGFAWKADDVLGLPGGPAQSKADAIMKIMRALRRAHGHA